MSIQGDITNRWKSGIYKNYSNLFKTKIDENSYSQFLPYAKYIIANFLPKDKGISILDIGCGIGGFTRAIFQAGYSQIKGVDISEDSVNAAHSYGLNMVQQGDIFKYLEGTADDSLDVILCLDVLEHFTREEGIRLLTETKRVLKPQGMMLIHVPNAEGIFGSKIRYADYTHEMAFTQKSISQLLQFVGFEFVTCFEDKPLVHGIMSGLRRFLWMCITFQFRFIHVVETGSYDIKLSQNILVLAIKTTP